MITNRIFLAFVLAFGFSPSIASAQSFWLHKEVGSTEFLAVIDSTDCVVANRPDFEVVTHDYWNSWNSVIVDTPLDAMEGESAFGGFVHPSRNLLIAAYTDYYGPVGHIVRSKNEGRTWTDFAIGIPTKFGGPINAVRAIAALDSNHIVALVGDTAGYECDRMILSSDAGITWQWVSTPIFWYEGSNSGLPANPVIKYLAPNTILVASDNAGYNSVIYRTSDLGGTWDSGFVAGTVITKFAFINPNFGFASGILYNLNAGIDTATIDKTTDGGVTWTEVLRKQIIPFSTTYFNNTAGLNSIAFADSLHGFACGEQGLILQTTDGGNTWNEMRSDYTIDAQGMDRLTDVAYPDTDHAMIASSDGSVLVYHPNGILSLPNITYPIFSPPAAPQTFNVTWDSVPGATHYSITITTSGYPDSTTATYLTATNIVDTFYHLSNLVDTSPPPATGGRQYSIYLQAFNATNESNVATRIFIVYQGTNGVTILPTPVSSMELFPNPATNSISIANTNGTISILDPLGRSYEVEQTGNTLDISALPSGVYFVSDGHTRAKFLKK